MSNQSASQHLSVPTRLLGVLHGALHRRRKYPTIQRVLQHWMYYRENRLPVRFLADLLTGARVVAPELPMGVSHAYELPYGERALLAALIGYLQPELMFEFGTFSGATTRLLADVAPASCVVHTLDLPDEAISDREVRAAIGREFRGEPRYADRIVSHRCDSRHFDIAAFRGRCDLVFVDASHAYADVLADSERALEMVSPRGMIIWDDYQSATLGVVQALNELSQRVSLVRIARSRLVVHAPRLFDARSVGNDAPWSEL